MRYLAGTLDEGLCYIKASGSLTRDFEVYSDADYARDPELRRSRSGFIALIGGTAVAWRSKEHGSVAFSSCDAEIYGQVDATKEALFLRVLL
jgi:hypothetical protein